MNLDHSTSECIQFGIGAIVAVVLLVGVFSLDGPPEKTTLDGRDCVVVQEQLYCKVEK